MERCELYKAGVWKTRWQTEREEQTMRDDENSTSNT